MKNGFYGLTDFESDEYQLEFFYFNQNVHAQYILTVLI